MEGIQDVIELPGARPTTVLDREIKQVEFVRASRVPAKRLYVDDGAQMGPSYRGRDYASIRNAATISAGSIRTV